MRAAHVIAVVCAACQGSSQPPTIVAAPTAASFDAAPLGAWGAPDLPRDASAVRELPPLPAATHGRAIVGVALADDGTAAVTIDSGTSVRLWPTLDGTREPVAIPLTASQEVVLARSGEQFHIAALDAAGGLVLVRVDASGRLVGKASMPFDQPYALVVAHGAHFLALRADQTIELLDASGTRLGTVVPEAGQRIATVIARRGRALAMVTTAEGVIARWLDTTSGLAWGAASPVLALDPSSAVLSPDHARLAGVQTKTRRAVIVELATGAVTPLRGQRTDLVPLAWLSAERVAFVHDEFELSRVEWFDDAGKRIAVIGHDFELEFLAVLAMQAADDRIVAFMGHQLVLVEPRTLRYLGYQAHAASRLRATPAGLVASLDGTAALLDDALQIERRAPLLPIDDTFALALGGLPRPGPFDDALATPPRRSSTTEVVLFEGQTRRQVLKMKVSEPRLRYEPATRLLATSGGTSVAFARFDPTTKRFAEPIVLPAKARIRDIFLVDPAIAGGAIAVIAHGDHAVRTIHEDELTGAPAREAIALPGALEAVDRAGHLYVRRADTVTIHAGTAEVGRLTGTKHLQVRPSPDGTRVALFGRGRVILANLDGTERWSIGFPGIKDLQWTDGELVALANGLAKLDPATGATVAARCGWKFGLRTAASFMDLAGSTICD